MSVSFSALPPPPQPPPSPSSESRSLARYNYAWRKCLDPKQDYTLMCVCVSYHM